MFLLVKRWYNSFWHVWDSLSLHSWNAVCPSQPGEEGWGLSCHTTTWPRGEALKLPFSVRQGQCSMQLLLIRWSVQNKKWKAWFKTVICCWLPFPFPEVSLRRGITESWHPLVGTLSSHLSRELTVSYHMEGHRNLFFLLNTQDSLCSLCLDWKSSYEGETISHTLGVRCLLHEGFPDVFKCIAEEASNVWENKCRTE